MSCVGFLSYFSWPLLLSTTTSQPMTIYLHCYYRSSLLCAIGGLLREKAPLFYLLPSIIAKIKLPEGLPQPALPLATNICFVPTASKAWIPHVFKFMSATLETCYNSLSFCPRLLCGLPFAPHKGYSTFLRNAKILASRVIYLN